MEYNHLKDVLRITAPGTEIRKGLDRIVSQESGALILLTTDEDYCFVVGSGLWLDVPITGQLIAELAKMDGAIVLDLIPEKKGEDPREKGLNERQIEALRLMVNEGKSLTNKEYRQKFDISRQTATRDLTELEEKNYVVGKGKRRSKHYVPK